MISDTLARPVSGHIGANSLDSSPQRMLIDRYRDRRLYFVTKRIFDVVVAATCLILLFPLLAVIALLIKLDSPGPIFFVQRRVGSRLRRSGQTSPSWGVSTFPFIKFRSMKTGADEGAHRAYIREWASGHAQANTASGEPKFKMTNNTRITRVGRILRKTSVDELPQLLNVLRGDMSLVSPRPVPIYEAELYQGEAWERLCAPPGLTGLWQVLGRGGVSFEEMVKLDLNYVRRRSWRVDVWILLKTPLAVISGRGAK